MGQAFDYDLLVLGGGSGGLAGALRAAAHGARVGLLEPGALGGTCVNVGCVPKKAMWLAADLRARVGLAAAIGFDLAESAPALDWQELVGRRQRYIDNIHASYRKRLLAAGVELLAERGVVVDAHSVALPEGRVLRARHLLVATGAAPQRPAIPGAELGSVSDDFFALRQAPARVALVGGGYIAVELAGLLQALGSQVTMFVRGPRLLAGFDGELAGRLQQELAGQGIELHFHSPLDALAEGADGRVRVLGAGLDEEPGFDRVFLATGRRPHGAGFGLEQAGVALAPDGAVQVDAWQTTSVPSIHAVGDVTGQLALTPVAVAAARRLMDRLFGGQAEARLDYANVPTVVFSHPPLATVGLSEEAARARHGEQVRCFRGDFRPMLHALADSPQRSLFKLVCVGEEERVVGIHLLGEGADEILQGFAVALKMGATRRQFEDTVAIHPTSAEEVVLLR